MQSPEMLTATSPMRGQADEEAAFAAQQTLLHMRLALKSQLHANGWQAVPLTDFRSTTYFNAPIAHHVVLHAPRGIPGVLIGGPEDGAPFPVEGHTPPLTVGMISGIDAEDRFGCDCYPPHDEEAEPPGDDIVWSHWMLDGLMRDSEGQWCWAYVSADSYGVSRSEQALHGSGSAHRSCKLCQLENWLRKRLLFLETPRAISLKDARQHAKAVPHRDTGCTACRVALPMGRTLAHPGTIYRGIARPSKDAASPRNAKCSWR